MTIYLHKNEYKGWRYFVKHFLSGNEKHKLRCFSSKEFVQINKLNLVRLVKTFLY